MSLPGRRPATTGMDALLPSSGALRGILLMVMSGLFSLLMHATIRHVSAELHPFEIAFFRNAFGFVVLAPLILRSGAVRTFRTRRIGLHAVRGAVNAVGMLTFFLALSLAPLAEVSALSFTAPLFATVLAAIVLGETVGPRRQAGLIAGFVGTLIILRPGLEIVGPGALLTLLSASAWACALIAIKTLTRTESSLTITAYAALFVALFSLPPALFVWQWPSAASLGWLIVIGFLGSLTQLCLAQSFAEADASVVLPFDFLKLVWASALGYIVFLERPDLWTWVGGAVIFASATYVAYRERATGRDPQAPAAVSQRG